MRAVVCGLLLLPFSAYASTLYYGGDWDGVAAPLMNVGNDGNIRHYDDFDLSSRSIVTEFYIHSFFINVPAQVSATFTLRQNIEPGNGGEVLAFEEIIAATSWGPTGRVYINQVGTTFREFRVRVDQLNIDLQPGKYWLQINPYASSICSPAIIPNSIGFPGQNHLSYQYSVFAQLNYVPHTADVSFGVEGYAVPEPTSLAAFGLFSLLAIRKRKPVN